MLVNGKHYRTVWMDSGKVRMINQPLLPHRFEIYETTNFRDTALAIKDMIVRGAGAIGAAAGFALAQAYQANEEIDRAAEHIKKTRPTAQNLFYAVDRVSKAKNADEALAIANNIANEDAEACRKIGEFGQELIKEGNKILTHCNAGWLAFVDWGSALSPIYAAKRSGKKPFVFVDETRPRMQGSRLTSWELKQEGIDHAIIADNAAGFYMRKKEIDLVIVGCDRLAANGDVVNKIGTYEKAVAAKENNIPFYVALPTSTIDVNVESGDRIPIEERDQEEVLEMFGLSKRNEVESIMVSPYGSKARNPAFDVTPAKYITGIITEKGIIKARKEDIQRVVQ